MAAKCPKCEKTFSHVNIEDVSVEAGRKSFKGVAYTCPYCSTAISVGLDPLLLQQETVKAIKGR